MPKERLYNCELCSYLYESLNVCEECGDQICDSCTVEDGEIYCTDCHEKMEEDNEI